MYTPKSNSRIAFHQSDKAVSLREELVDMVQSPLYNTKIYSVLEDTAGTHFVEKHMNYMGNHLKLDHWQYVSNLKLMTKIKVPR